MDLHFEIFRIHAVYLYSILLLHSSDCSFFHLLIRYLQSTARRHDVNLIATIVVGSGDEATRTVESLAEKPDLGYRVVAMLGSRPPSKSVSGIPYLGEIDLLPSIVTNLAVREVIIADENVSSERLFETMMKIGRNSGLSFASLRICLTYCRKKRRLNRLESCQ